MNRNYVCICVCNLACFLQVCTKGKQHIMKYLHITAIREDKARQGMLTEIDAKRFRKSLPPAVYDNFTLQCLSEPF